MTLIPRTLWDLLVPAKRRRARRPARRGQTPAVARRRGIQDRYDALVVDMKEAYGIRVHRWRTSSSGCAWEVRDRAGRVSRLIESPRPKGPMSCAIFLHEVGHHAIGFRRYRPRCLEEYHAWRWALETMRAHGFNVTASVEKRMADSLRYAVQKAVRRGLKRVPVELGPYL